VSVVSEKMFDPFVFSLDMMISPSMAYVYYVENVFPLNIRWQILCTLCMFMLNKLIDWLIFQTFKLQ